MRSRRTCAVAVAVLATLATAGCSGGSGADPTPLTGSGRRGVYSALDAARFVTEALVRP